MDDILIARAIDWDTGVNTGTSKPDDNATVGATAGTDLKKSSGSVLSDSQVITNMGTAANTSKVNDAETESGYDYDVYGDVYMRNGTDITFYDSSSTKQGSIYGSSGTDPGLTVDGTRFLALYGGNSIIELDGDGNEINCYISGYDIFNIDSNSFDCGVNITPRFGTLALGAIGSEWLKVYTSDLVVSDDATIGGTLTVTKSTTFNSNLIAQSGHVFLGTKTNYFWLHYKTGGTWYHVPAYTDNSST
jgi:hypothetical protein